MSQALAAPPELAPTPPAEEALYEVVNGQRVELPPMAADAVLIASTLDQYLGSHVRMHRLGRVMTEMLFFLRPDQPQRRPDVSYVSYERWPRGRRVPSDNAWEVVPDLAVEVVSPSNTAKEVVGKVREYFEAGVRRVWVVYPDERLVYDYESPTRLRVLGPGEALDGGDLIRGFRLDVAALFEDVVGEEGPAVPEGPG